MRVVVSGGGTGGHIYPALALMRYLESQGPVEYLYVGTERGLESKIVPQAGYEFASIKIQGLRRSLSLENLKTVYYMVTSVQKAKKLLREFQPDVVIGTGGYVCAPVLYAASRLGIPTIIHEQNSIAGVTNKFLARYVDRIAICFEDVAKDFSKYANKVILTGNPRGQEVVDVPVKENYLSELGIPTDKPIVVIFGGSRGAEKINQSFLDALPELGSRPYHVVMVTGEIHYDKINNQMTNLGQDLSNISVLPYIKDMPQLFKQADLVVCRSGATTLTELTAMGLPSILIPSPYVTANHQEANAMSIVKVHGAEMILEQDLSKDTLLAAMDRIMTDSELRHRMAKATREKGITDASKRLEKLISDII